MRIYSFGYKVARVPLADVTIDLRRLLPNPHHVPALRDLDGRAEAVQRWCLANGGEKIIERAKGMVLSGEVQSLAFGCVGGKHRSVAMAILLRERLKGLVDVCVDHLEFALKCKSCGLPPGAHRVNDYACPSGQKTKIGYIDFSASACYDADEGS